MRAYFDAGPFLDYLRFRTTLADTLRTKGRRGRSPADISGDLDACLERLKVSDNSCITSSLTFVELERVLYSELMGKSRNVVKSNKAAFLLLSGRSLVDSIYLMCKVCNISVVELKVADVLLVLDDREMKERGLDFGDSLHLATAIRENADAILTADEDLLKVDGVFRAASGSPIRCVDSDGLRGMV